MRSEPIESIPSYGLYGERWSGENPNFVHLETIQASSEPFEGLIKPHRHAELYQLLIVKGGQLTLTVDENQQLIDQPSILALPPLVIHGFNFSDDIDGYILTLATPLLRNQAWAGLELTELGTQAMVVPLSDTQLLPQHLITLVDLLKAELDQATDWRVPICEQLVGSILLWLHRATEVRARSDNLKDSQQRKLLQFHQLVEQHFADNWKVPDYAGALGSSTATLNRLAQKHLGVSASELVHQRLIQEAKRRLIYTRRSLEQIAAELGFDDPAYFSRFFKRLTGHPPSHYRRANTDPILKELLSTNPTPPQPLPKDPAEDAASGR